MKSSNELLLEFSRCSERQDPNFSLVVAFDFYDGPERGMAIFPSGQSVRFVVLGESRSRLFRAFELITVDGDWWQYINTLPEAKRCGREALTTITRVIVPRNNSNNIQLFEQCIKQAMPTGTYVGVGSPYLEWLSITSISMLELEKIKKLSDPAAFDAVHQMLKKKSNKI